MNNPFRVLYVFLAILLLTSCRKETYELVEAPKEQNLEANSSIATLMQRTSMNDGSNDNILDKANCFNVQLPITVIANGQEIAIDSAADYDLIEVIFDASDLDEDILSIQFPITVIRNDFSEVLVNTQTELFDLASTCNGENMDDDDIECIDFVYPITASIFNKTSELTDRATFSNDKQLYDFIEDLDENIVVNVDFPIAVIISDGTTNVINDLVVLETAIEDIKDDCDEDDDYDFNDDDEEEEEEGTINASEQEFTNLLTSCKWTVEEIELANQNLTTTYSPYVFIFNSDGTISVEGNGNTSAGTWSITSLNDGLILQIIMDTLTDLNNEWPLHEINFEDDGTRFEIDKGEDEIKFKQDCT